MSSSSSSVIIIIICHHHHNFHHHHQELLFHHPLKQARKLRDEVYGSETYMPTNQVNITQRNQVVIQRSSLHLLNIPTNQVKKNFANSKIKLGSPASSLKSLFSTISTISTVSTISTILLILITNQISIPIILSILCILGYLGLGSALFCQWEGNYNVIINITLLQ